MVLRGRAVFEAAQTSWRRGVAAGMFSYAAFWTVIWTLTLAPMAPVAALRETSIVFAVLFGIVFLRESLNVVRLLVTGAVLLRRPCSNRKHG
jgi:uncharacterized membrane protein